MLLGINVTDALLLLPEMKTGNENVDYYIFPELKYLCMSSHTLCRRS